MAVLVASVPRKFRKLDKPIARLARRILRHLKKKKWALEIYLVGNHEMPKNVLAFPATPHFPRPDVKGKFLGELILNPSYIEDHGESLVTMLIHGCLHLVGYDHVRKDDRMRMVRKEKELRALLGN